MAWNPSAYLKFGAARLRPAVDLLTRATGVVNDISQVKSVLDLGCGTGHITGMICNAFPNAAVEGLDSSPQMIGRALRDHEDSDCKDRISFRVGSVENEAKFSKKKYDLVYSNAALHWCTSHGELFPDIVKSLVNPNGGVLAVQMPDTRVQTSHVLMDTAAFRSGMLDKLRHVRIPRVEHDPSWYFDLLSPLAKEMDMWTTDYAQQLPATAPSYSDTHETSAPRHPVLEFTKSTGLLPIIEALGGEGSPHCQTYLNEYDRLLYEAYPIVKFKKGRIESDPQRIEHLRELSYQYVTMVGSINELNYLRNIDCGEKLDPRDKIRATASRVGLSVPRFADDELPTELPPQPAKRDKNDEATGGGNIDYSITTA